MISFLTERIKNPNSSLNQFLPYFFVTFLKRAYLL